ncbi:MAG: ATP-sensitive inward rectifier potassium channel 10 [Alphaproteobacteria bacterium]|nr:ATP-sensitive inward rectifier potassium channel 10 [Alphaproteobacteria bacterium]
MKEKKHSKKAILPRLVPREGDPQIVRVGNKNLFFKDMYVTLLAKPWFQLLGICGAFYLLSNLFFASIYYINLDGIEHATGFADAFFFSVQTMATIGYGRMAPITLLANFVVTFEALWGFAFFAFMTGLVFAKFSRPTAHVLFTDVAVISDYDGVPHFKIRLANQRHNRIVDATAHLILLRNVVTKEGYTMRRFVDLHLERNHVPFLQLSWTLLHKIDENSPLFGLSLADMRNQGDEIIVTLVGVDETLSQTIHARHSYLADEIIPGGFFEDIIQRVDDHVEVDYSKFHTVRVKEGF